MSAEQIGIDLKGRRNGTGWLVCCPCPNHGKGRGDRFPSLSIADAEDGGLLLHCFAGCGFIDILRELKRRGLVDGRAPVHPAPTRSKPKPHDPDPEALKILGRVTPPAALDRCGISRAARHLIAAAIVAVSH